MAHIPGKDGFGRNADIFVEQRDNGARVLFSTPPAGVFLDWHGLDVLLEQLGEYRRSMPGEPRRAD